MNLYIGLFMTLAIMIVKFLVHYWMVLTGSLCLEEMIWITLVYAV